MAMGLVSLEEFSKEIEVAEIKTMERGRGNKKEVPMAIKKLVASTAIEGTPAKEVAEAFGVSQSSVNAYKNGATSTTTYHEKNEELADNNRKVKDEIVTGARSRILSAISNITDDKLAEAKLRDIASVARDMSAVIKNLEPEQEREDRPSNFIFYAPQFKKTDRDYKVIEVTE